MAKKNNNTLKNILARFIIYTLVTFGITSSLPIIIGHGDIVMFSENGPIEDLQLILLVISAVILLFFSRTRTCSFRELFSILAVLIMFAAIREMDKFLDSLIPTETWELLAYSCAAVGIFIYWRKRDAFTVQMDAFIKTRAFSLLWCGFIIAVPFAQLVGHGTFLKLLMGDDYNRNYKKVIEELGEFIGYLLIFIGSVEAVLQQKEVGNACVVENVD